MAGNPTGKPSTDSTASVVQSLYFDHSDCIPHSSLPPPPAGWHGPWEAQCTDQEKWYVCSDNTCRIDDLTKDEAQFLAALLNVTHPASEDQK